MGQNFVVQLQPQLKFNPYIIAKFDVLQKDGCVYVDMTRYIELLERSAIRVLLIVRPRRFGNARNCRHPRKLCSALLRRFAGVLAMPAAAIEDVPIRGGRAGIFADLIGKGAANL